MGLKVGCAALPYACMDATLACLQVAQTPFTATPHKFSNPKTTYWVSFLCGVVNIEPVKTVCPGDSGVLSCFDDYRGCSVFFMDKQDFSTE